MKTILSILTLFFVLSQGSFAADVATNVGKIQASSEYSGSVPSGGEQKGFIGKVLSDIFWATGLIKNEFITAFQTIEGNFTNNIPKWDGNKFVEGSMRYSGTSVVVGGDMRINGELNNNGTILNPGAPWPGSLWSNTGNNTYKTTGRVGIGTSSPAAQLHTTGAARFDGGVQVNGVRAISDTNRSHTAQSNLGDYGYFEVKNNAGNRGAYFGAGNGGDRVNLGLSNGVNLNISGGATGGNVGIGVNDPEAKLHVNGSIKIPFGTGIILSEEANGGFNTILGRHREPGVNSALDTVIVARGGTTMLLNANAGGTGDDAFTNARFSIGTRTPGNSGIETWGTGYQELFTMNASGKFGIGVTNPTESLDVDGKIRMRNQTVAGDSADMVATKGYVDSISGSNDYTILIPAVRGEDYKTTIVRGWRDNLEYTETVSFIGESDYVLFYKHLGPDKFDISDATDIYIVDNSTEIEVKKYDDEGRDFSTYSILGTKENFNDYYITPNHRTNKNEYLSWIATDGRESDDDTHHVFSIYKIQN